MFINCPNCSALVATDLATGQPPERCSRCGFGPLADQAKVLPAFPAAPLAPPPEPEPEPVRPQGRPVFIPLTPSRPSGPPAGDEAPGPRPPGPAGQAEPATPTPGPAPAATPPTDLAPAAAVAPPTPEHAPVALQPEAPGPEAAAGKAALVESAVAASTVGEAPVVEAPITEPPDAESPVVEPASTKPPGDATTPAAASTRPAPRFLARGTGDAAPLDRRHVAIAAGLALLLVVQLLLADRDRLAGHAAWRPLVAALCAPLPCSVPPWREAAAIRVQERDVRPAPGRPGVLSVSATIHNEARWAQAWPQLVLTFSDLDGRALGMRAFEPAEYLAAPPTDVTIASGQQAAITIDLVEPSPHAVAFNFDFR